jgi:hypothetical protein
LLIQVPKPSRTSSGQDKNISSPQHVIVKAKSTREQVKNIESSKTEAICHTINGNPTE